MPPRPNSKSPVRDQREPGPRGPGAREPGSMEPEQRGPGTQLTVSNKNGPQSSNHEGGTAMTSNLALFEVPIAMTSPNTSPVSHVMLTEYIPIQGYQLKPQPMNNLQSYKTATNSSLVYPDGSCGVGYAPQQQQMQVNVTGQQFMQHQHQVLPHGALVNQQDDHMKNPIWQPTAENNYDYSQTQPRVEQKQQQQQQYQQQQHQQLHQYMQPQHMQQPQYYIQQQQQQLQQLQQHVVVEKEEFPAVVSGMSQQIGNMSIRTADNAEQEGSRAALRKNSAGRDEQTQSYVSPATAATYPSSVVLLPMCKPCNPAVTYINTSPQSQSMGIIPVGHQYSNPGFQNSSSPPSNGFSNLVTNGLVTPGLNGSLVASVNGFPTPAANASTPRPLNSFTNSVTSFGSSSLPLSGSTTTLPPPQSVLCNPPFIGMVSSKPHGYGTGSQPFIMSNQQTGPYNQVTAVQTCNGLVRSTPAPMYDAQTNCTYAVTTNHSSNHPSKSRLENAPQNDIINTAYYECAQHPYYPLPVSESQSGMGMVSVNLPSPEFNATSPGGFPPEMAALVGYTNGGQQQVLMPQEHPEYLAMMPDDLKMMMMSGMPACPGGFNPLMNSANMEAVWHGYFDMMFRCFLLHSWTLTPTTDVIQDTNFILFNDSAKVRFLCANCCNAWTSMKGRVMFWFNLDPLRQSGRVCFKLFGQKCQKCQPEEFEHAMWYPEEVKKVLQNLYNRVGSTYYGLTVVNLNPERRAGKPRTQHNSSLCQACASGICREGGVGYPTTPSFSPSSVATVAGSVLIQGIGQGARQMQAVM